LDTLFRPPRREREARAFQGATDRFTTMRPIAVLAAVALVAVAGISGYVAGIGAGRSSTSTLTSISTTTVMVTSPSLTTTTVTNTSNTSSPITILPEGATFQVQSSYDCLASYFAVPFNVTAAGATLQGRISASGPVSIYLATAQDAQTTIQGHPASYESVTSPNYSTGFFIGISPGAYVLWVEGDDMGCGTPVPNPTSVPSVVTPLEQITNVTVSQAVTLTPGLPNLPGLLN